MALEFDSFFVRHGGISDEGNMEAIVVMGFWDAEKSRRQNIEVPVLFKADVTETIASARQRATDLAFIQLKQAVELLKENSAEDLHRIAQEQFKASSQRRDEEITAGLGAAFSKL